MVVFWLVLYVEFLVDVVDFFVFVGVYCVG